MTFTPVMYYKGGRSVFAMTRAEAVDLEYNGWVKNPTATPPPPDPAPGGGTGLVLGTTATTAKRGDYVPTWLEVTGKPATFPPDAHLHPVNSLSDASVVGKSILTAATAAAIRSLLGVDTGTGSSGLTLGTTSTTAKAGDYVPSWTEVTGKPVAFVPTTHVHVASQVTDFTAAAQSAAELRIKQNADGSWPSRTTVTANRSVCVTWVGTYPGPPYGSGVDQAAPGVDVMDLTPVIVS